MRKLEKIQNEKAIKILEKKDSKSVKGGTVIDLLDWSKSGGG